MTDGNSFDIVVIGAGPAGATAARRARDLGRSVALIDKATFPRPKLCGALVSPRSHKAIARLHDMKMPQDMYLVSHKFGLHWEGNEERLLEAPYELTYTYRTIFDAWLLDSALKAGAVDMTGTRVAEFLDGENALLLADGRRIEYSVLIGCDGVASPVAKHLFGKAFDTEKIGFAYEVETAKGCEPEAPMSIEFNIVQWGYGWNFPKKDSRTIGVAGVRGHEQDLRERMNAYLVQEGVDPATVKVKGAHIPFGDFREKPGRGNILLAGDAAGFVDAITGEGIALAIESGGEAAEAAAEVIAAGRPMRADRAYFKRIKYIQDDLEKVRRLRVIAFSSQMRDLFKQKLGTSALLHESMFDLLAGNLTYGEIERKVAKRAFMRVAKGISAWPSILSRKTG